MFLFVLLGHLLYYLLGLLWLAYGLSIFIWSLLLLHGINRPTPSERNQKSKRFQRRDDIPSIQITTHDRGESETVVFGNGPSGSPNGVLRRNHSYRRLPTSGSFSNPVSLEIPLANANKEEMKKTAYSNILQSTSKVRKRCSNHHDNISAINAEDSWDVPFASAEKE